MEAVLAGFLLVFFVAVAANTIPLAVGASERGRLQDRATNLAASVLADERQKVFADLAPGQADLPDRTEEGVTFRTHVSVLEADPRRLTVRVRVAWSDRSGPREISLEGPVLDVRR